MKQFLETICICQGIPQHLEWHQLRVDATLQHFYPAHHHSWTLLNCIKVPPEFHEGIVRCRIEYVANRFSIHYYPYRSRNIKSLKLVEGPLEFDYRFKYADRKILEDLYQQKGDADDILITRHGWITDTSIANIAFEKNGRWYTPSIPLLAGTTWKRLVSSGILIPTPIHKSQLHLFESFKLFNAMREWDLVDKGSVKNISI